MPAKKNTYQEGALLLVDLGERRDLCEPGVVLDGLVLQLREAPHAELGHARLVVGEVLREGPSINDVRKESGGLVGPGEDAVREAAWI